MSNAREYGQTKSEPLEIQAEIQKIRVRKQREEQIAYQKQQKAPPEWRPQVCEDMRDRRLAHFPDAYNLTLNRHAPSYQILTLRFLT